MIYSAINDAGRDPFRQITENIDLPEARGLLLNYFDLEDCDPEHEEKLSQKLIEMMEWKTPQIEEVLRLLEINFGVVVMLSQSLDEKYWNAQHTRTVKVRHRTLVENGGEATHFLHTNLPPQNLTWRPLTDEEQKTMAGEISDKLVKKDTEPLIDEVDTYKTMLMNYYDLEEGQEEELAEKLISLMNLLSLDAAPAEHILKMLEISKENITHIYHSLL